MKKSNWIVLGVFAIIVVAVLLGSTAMNKSLAVSRAARAAQATVVPTVAPELAYKRIAINHLKNLAEGMKALGAALKEPRIGESDWALQVTMAAGQIQDAHTYMGQAQAPAELAALHKQITDATRACSAAADATIVWLNNPTDVMLQVGTSFVGDCNDLLLPAITALGDR